MRLIVHIGLHKTGTTTLQRDVLIGKSGYLGKFENNRNDHPYEVSELSDLVTRFHLLDRAERRERVSAYVDRLFRIAETFRTPTSLKISEERLSNWMETGDEGNRWPIRYGDAAHAVFAPRRHRIPFVSLLEEDLLPTLAARGGSLRVVLSLRNQPEWLGSFYAQSASRIRGAGQRNFETQIAALIAGRDASIDFMEMVRSLEAVLGRDGLRILLQEDMGAPDFADRAVEAFDLQDCALGMRLMSSRNVKSSGEGLWKIKGRKGRWPDLFGRTGSPEIRLTDALRDRIRSHCAAGNAALAGYMGRDLAALGY
ncbi:hypothetical protein [Paragemmobacter straminiformis]|uniref:Sulfotransferase family protein n=1 Tax=Paragemmobacter straminiformis TaxID=2045119 RepID=A0A842IFR5_9RHOB|nr:hypothetical protein [Gemmobacter straminiformis]MBC2837438.1 hypothetical protein [Gemmobacter straminiformis]